MQAAGGPSINNTGTAPGNPQAQSYQVVTSQHSTTSTHSVTSPHYAVVNFAQKTSPSGAANQTGTGSASASQRSSKSSTGNRTGSSREATPPPVPPHPPPEDSNLHNGQGFHNNQSNMQPIPQVSDWSIQVT